MFGTKTVRIMLSAIGVLAGAGALQASIPGCSGVTPPTVSVSGGYLWKNGQHFILRGLQIRGFVSALQVSNDNATWSAAHPTSPNASGVWAVDAAAQGAYGDTELAMASSWDANVIRIQVSQPSLDPNDTETDLEGNPLYSTSYNYQKAVVNAVNKARCNGFVVIVSMQDEKNSGETNHQALPTAATQRAWNGLLSAFGGQSDVMFEIYNEPSLSDTSMNWISWAHAGQTSYDNTYGNPNGWFGMQKMLDYMRSNGASNNVLIMDGIQEAATLDGVPGLTNPPVDSSANALYAVHPYLRGGTTSQYDAEFRTVSPLAYPVIGTEWSAGAYDDPTGGIGLEGQPYDMAVQALNYFAQYNIHIVAGAFDVPGIMTQDISSWTPTNYDNYSTEESNPDTLDNAGLLVQKLFQNKYNVTLVDSDGVTP
ncbi:MAG: cellulase family glycosylhydrolase [Acidobacteriota bacterium]